MSPQELNELQTVFREKLGVVAGCFQESIETTCDIAGHLGMQVHSLHVELHPTLGRSCSSAQLMEEVIETSTHRLRCNSTTVKEGRLGLDLSADFYVRRKPNA